MLSVADQVVEDYRAIRICKDGKEYTYDVAYRLLNSMNFGVAQSRERLIYIAVRDDISKAKNVTPESLFKEIEDSYIEHEPYNLNSALEYIKPLDAPRIKGMTEVDDDKTGMKIGLNTFSSTGNEYLNTINQGRQFLMYLTIKPDIVAMLIMKYLKG